MNRHQRRAAKKTAPELPSATVCLAVPSGPYWHGAMVMCTIQMMLDTLFYSTPGYDKVYPVIKNARGSCIWRQRADSIQDALDRDCTHLLFIDTDQTFPATTLRRLLAHGKEVVAANVAIKQFPSLPTARNLVDGESVPVFSLPESKGLEEVWRIGTGVMMIDLSIMKQLEKPWFVVNSEGPVGNEDQVGEDWYFCSLLERAGIPIYIDHDLSKEVGHVGYMTYTHDHIPPELAAETQRIYAEEFGDKKGKFNNMMQKIMTEYAI